MRLLIIFLALFFCSVALQAQTYDTSKLSIANTQALNQSSQKFSGKTNTDNNGVGIILSAGAFHPFNKLLKDSFLQTGLFMPSFGFTFGRNFSFFVEFARARAVKLRNAETVSVSMNFVNSGFSNQVHITDRIGLRQKFGISFLTLGAENIELPNHINIGFIAGGGLQTRCKDRLLLYFDASYIYQQNNFGGIRLEPGLLMQF